MITEEEFRNGKSVSLLSDDELEKATGGYTFYTHIVSKPEDVRFIFYTGDIVTVSTGIGIITHECKIIKSDVFKESNGYSDVYLVRSVDCQPGDSGFIYCWVSRDDIRSA